MKGVGKRRIVKGVGKRRIVKGVGKRRIVKGVLFVELDDGQKKRSSQDSE